MLQGKVAVIYGAGSIGSTVAKAGGIPETIGDDVDPAVVQGIVDATMIGKPAIYEDVGNVAVFAASDQARMMTAATLNISGGSVID